MLPLCTNEEMLSDPTVYRTLKVGPTRQISHKNMSRICAGTLRDLCTAPSRFG